VISTSRRRGSASFSGFLCIQLPCRFFQIETWIQLIVRCGFSPPDAIRRATPRVERTIQRWPEKNSVEPEFIPKRLVRRSRHPYEAGLRHSNWPGVTDLPWRGSYRAGHDGILQIAPTEPAQLRHVFYTATVTDVSVRVTGR
jgi:hypothetical protein